MANIKVVCKDDQTHYNAFELYHERSRAVAFTSTRRKYQKQRYNTTITTAVKDEKVDINTYFSHNMTSKEVEK